MSGNDDPFSEFLHNQVYAPFVSANAGGGGNGACYVIVTNSRLNMDQYKNQGFTVLNANLDDLFSRVSSPEHIRPRDILQYARELIGPDVTEVYVYDGAKNLYSVSYVEAHYPDGPRAQNPPRQAWYTAGSFPVATGGCSENDIATLLGFGNPAQVQVYQYQPSAAGTPTPTLNPTQFAQFEFQGTPSQFMAAQGTPSVGTTPTAGAPLGSHPSDWQFLGIFGGVLLGVALLLSLTARRPNQQP